MNVKSYLLDKVHIENLHEYVLYDNSDVKAVNQLF